MALITVQSVRSADKAPAAKETKYNALTRIIRSDISLGMEILVTEMEEGLSVGSPTPVSDNRQLSVHHAQRYFGMVPCDKESARPNSRAESPLDWNWMICLSLGVRSRGLDMGGEILAWPNNAADSRGRCRRCPSNRVTHATCASISMRIYYAHSQCGSFIMGAKKAVNVSIQSELLDAARTEDINLSATLEAALADQLRIRRRDRWQTENEAAIEAYNRDVDQNSSFGDHARSF